MTPRPTDAALSLYNEALVDPDLGSMRKQFCRTAASSLESVASWLGVDSFLGAGDVDDATATSGAEPNPERYAAFRAVSAVIEMASELATGSIALMDQGHRFASAVLIRQLLETEYLLMAFSLDFSSAARWARSSPADIRRSFTPKDMRAVGGFSNQEYWAHCDMGGHPAPLGRTLLRFTLDTSPMQDARATAAIWGDLAQHLRRLWATMDGLLDTEHARYARVRHLQCREMRQAEAAWTEADPLSSPVDFQILNQIADNLSEGD